MIIMECSVLLALLIGRREGRRYVRDWLVWLVEGISLNPHACRMEITKEIIYHILGSCKRGLWMGLVIVTLNAFSVYWGYAFAVSRIYLFRDPSYQEQWRSNGSKMMWSCRSPTKIRGTTRSYIFYRNLMHKWFCRKRKKKKAINTHQYLDIS